MCFELFAFCFLKFVIVVDFWFLHSAQMERQMEMQRQMFQKQMAMQIAMKRDQFHFMGAFYSILFPVLTGNFIKTKNPSFLAPMLPLSFIGAYVYDAAYGSKMHRVRLDAEHLLHTQPSLFSLPLGFPSLTQIDSNIAARKDATGQSTEAHD
jgi:hypothetical protein